MAYTSAFIFEQIYELKFTFDKCEFWSALSRVHTLLLDGWFTEDVSHQCLVIWRDLGQKCLMSSNNKLPNHCFARYTGFRWGSGSPIKWLFWLTRCGSLPHQRISASWYRPMHHLRLCALPMLVVPHIHTELARCTFSVAATSNWNLLTFDCVKTFSLSYTTWKPIYSYSLSPPVLHQVPLYLQT